MYITINYRYTEHGKMMKITNLY